MAAGVAVGPVDADFAGTLSFVTDQAYRGYSKTYSDPGMALNLDYRHASGWFAGTWLTSVAWEDYDYAERANWEIRPYLGYGAMLTADWRIDGQVSRYLYDGQIYQRSSDFNEFAAQLHYRDLLTVQVTFAYDAYERRARTFTYEAVGRWPLTDTLLASAALGFYQAGELVDSDYFFWNAGFTYYLGRRIAFDLRYVDAHLTHDDHGEIPRFQFDPLETPLVFSISVGF